MKYANIGQIQEPMYLNSDYECAFAVYHIIHTMSMMYLTENYISWYKYQIIIWEIICHYALW